MENLCLNSKRAIEELERGREFLSQLRRVIQRSDGGGGGGEDDDGSKTTPFAQLDLAEKVERSFCNTLAMLNRRGGEDSDDVVSQMLTDYSSCLVPAKSEDSEDTCKSTSAVKERRGCYKRRKTSQTWERNSEAPIDDGHAWRKYGQKTIMNAKFPRNYFRCTHKFDQGCLATKQVQMIQEEPVLYRTTYYGHHTCNRNLLNPEIILDSASPNSDSSILLSFDNNNNSLSSKQDLPFFSSSSPSPSPSKEYCKQEIPSSSSEDYLLTNELINTLSSTLESNHKDVIPDVLYDSVDFNGFFEPFDV